MFLVLSVEFIGTYEFSDHYFLIVYLSYFFSVSYCFSLILLLFLPIYNLGMTVYPITISASFNFYP